MSHKMSGVTGPKFTRFLPDVREIVVDVKATIDVAIFPSVVKYQQKQ